MAKLREQTLTSMRQQGFLHLSEAATTTGLAESTLWSWATSGRVRWTRVGALRFLEIESLRDVAGPVFVERKSVNGGAPATNRKNKGGSKC
jgi:predicted DNA-binding transcriptional regulator AlpA